MMGGDRKLTVIVPRAQVIAAAARAIASAVDKNPVLQRTMVIGIPHTQRPEVKLLIAVEWEAANRSFQELCEILHPALEAAEAAYDAGDTTILGTVDKFGQVTPIAPGPDTKQ